MKQMVWCGACGERFEKATRIGPFRLHAAYCSDTCRDDGYRERARLRQENWRKRFIDKHGATALRTRLARYTKGGTA